MDKKYHSKITQSVLTPKFSRQAVETIVSSNLRQDRLGSLIFHPEYHFDNSLFEEGYAYIEQQRELILSSLKNENQVGAWQAFGRISHALQDFYSHSNYVRMWVDQHNNGQPRVDLKDLLPPEGIDPTDEKILNGHELISGHVYIPWEAFYHIPLVGNTFRYLLPRNSHAWMNLDGPHAEPFFIYAYLAGSKRTRIELERLENTLIPDQYSLFTGQTQ